MALTLWHPPIFEVAPAPPPNRSLLAARRRLSRLRPQPALHLAELSSQLERFSFFVLDDFAGRDQAELVSSEVGARALCRVPSGERRGRVHAGQHVSSLRSDVSTWVPVDRAGSTSSSSPALDRLVNRTDALVAALRSEANCAPLAHVTRRSADAQVACYPANGSQYIRHMDNVCTYGAGARCNGRRLTLVYYLNDLKAGAASATTSAADFVRGALRLFNQGPPTSAPLIDIEPSIDRLVGFLSDDRVPHAVLPTMQDRAAVTLWYFDERELKHVKDDGTSPSLHTLTPRADDDTC